MIDKKSVNDFKAADRLDYETTITKEMVDAFAAVSGDFSTIHIDDCFAKSRGFKGRIAHGVLLNSILSRLIGMHFPGENGLLQKLESRFIAPAYVGDTLLFEVVVDHVSTAANAIVLRCNVVNQASAEIVMRSKLQVGFTNGTSCG